MRSPQMQQHERSQVKAPAKPQTRMLQMKLDNGTSLGVRPVKFTTYKGKALVNVPSLGSTVVDAGRFESMLRGKGSVRLVFTYFDRRGSISTLAKVGG